ncbi:AMP-binding protein [Hazenella coriacea]|uniref:Acyl-CoA synthetase (AMP-forming)/AMP-acid ligase II n=1 Tax=Hazenella coriacea TaxID=1179467 RepID=A0A4R3L9K4_9BACL|nr:AMP-binding protein [Hazenella coriacea]TCS95800.1 acyl-CoA synthetase (AMP-forming)/AMP-acid ligase II [Hazenella coriacea]
MIQFKSRTLIDVMLQYMEHGDTPWGHGFFNPRTQTFDPLSNQQLTGLSFAFGHLLVENGVKPKELCLIVCATPLTQLLAFYASLSIGAIPLLMPNPKALSGDDDLQQRIQRWKNNLFSEKTSIIVDSQSRLWLSDLETELPVIQLPEQPLEMDVMRQPALEMYPHVDEIAYLQMTSASTGTGKAVAITHRNIISNVTSIHVNSNAGEEERICSWLPLNHDMGLVGAELFSYYHHYPVLLMSPYDFLRRPHRWLEAISQYRCTLSPSPNFGYDYCYRMIPDERVKDLDLSSWNIAYNGAEPIRAETIHNFYQKFHPIGLEKETIIPVYGLAEATLAVTFSEPYTLPRFVIVNKSSLDFGRKAELVAEGIYDLEKEPPWIDLKLQTLAFSVGKPLPGVTVFIQHEEGEREQQDLICGEIVVQGDSIAYGTLTPETKEAKVFDQEVQTGDFGFMYQGNLYVVERIKNMIIRHGENYFANLLEKEIAEELGITEERIAVFESDLYNSESDLIALIEKDPVEIGHELLHLKEKELPITRYVFTKKRAIPRTSSGKKRHFLCRRLWQLNQLPVIQIYDVSRWKYDRKKV